MKALDLIHDPDFIEEITKKNYVLGASLHRSNSAIKELEVPSSRIICRALLLLNEKGLLEEFNKNSRGTTYEVLHEPLNEYLEDVWIGKF